jgi:hypothetical protein
LETSTDASALGTKPMNMSQCTLQHRHLRTMSDMMNGGTYSDKQVNTLREAATTAPQPTDPIIKAQLDRAGTIAPTRADMPAWVEDVVRRRDSFRNVVFFVTVDGRTEHYTFLYAMQQPFYIAVCPLERSVIYVDVQEVRGDTWAILNEAKLRYLFKCNYAKLCQAADLPNVPRENVSVLVDCFYTGGTTVSSQCNTIPFLIYLHTVPEPTRAAGAGDAARKGKHRKVDDVDDLPWLRGCHTDFDFWSASAPTKGKKKPSGGRADSDSNTGDELAADDLDLGLTELHAARASLLDDVADDSFEDFIVQVLGGKWLKAHMGRQYDAVSGSCRNDNAE